MELEKKVCPDCNGSGVYQEYDEYDRYTVHSCATCDGSGEIARQSVTSEEVESAIDWLETGDFEIIAGDEEYTANSSHHPNTSRFRKTAITALQAYQPWVSVEDRPKKDNKYLVVLQFYKEPKDRIIEVVEYYGEWKVNYEWNVVCYKPLPEPPKGE